jgi:hypothetical protein
MIWHPLYHDITAAPGARLLNISFMLSSSAVLACCCWVCCLYLQLAERKKARTDFREGERLKAMFAAQDKQQQQPDNQPEEGAGQQQ